MNNRIKSLLSITLALCGINILFCQVIAQNVVTSGTNIKINSGTTITSVQDLAVQNGGGLTVDGSLILKKNLVNQNPTGNLGNGTIEFSGTIAQSATGQNTIGTMVVNNPAGLDVNGNTVVNTSLALQSGHIRLGSNNLTLGSAASVSGTPSSSAMVIATGIGELRKSFSGIGTFTFPVGDNSGTADYAPVAVTFAGGNFGPENYLGVKSANSAFPGSSGNYLNRYWELSQNGITDPQYDAVFQYVAADVVGDENNISGAQVLPSPTVYFTPANTSLHQFSAAGLTTFGTFTGLQALVNKILNLNLYLEGLYAGGGVMNKAQNGSGDQFTANIADKVAVELHQSANYNTVAYTDNNVSLLTNGVASVSIPAAQSGSFYVTVKHRNSVSITSKLPVSFAGSTINYSFTQPSLVFGNNLKTLADGQYAIYSGDSNQDGVVNAIDMLAVKNHAETFGTGYISEDINGDGIVDALDMILLDNNAASFVTVILP